MFIFINSHITGTYEERRELGGTQFQIWDGGRVPYVLDYSFGNKKKFLNLTFEYYNIPNT